MIIHCTRKLYARIPAALRCGGNGGLIGDGVLGDWHAELYIIDRRHCLLFCHDSTRFVVLMPGVTRADLPHMASRHRELFLACLRESGVAGARVCRAALALGLARCDHRTDRSVLGSMRVVRGDLDGLLDTVAGVMHLDPIKASVRLNQRPASVRGASLRPQTQMQRCVESL